MTKNKLYHTIRQIHLYASFCTAAFILMYVVTSYMMMYHDVFKPGVANETTTVVNTTPDEVSDENWNTFMKENKIRGRLFQDNNTDSGEVIRSYENADGNIRVTISSSRDEVEIKTSNLNASARIIKLHRLRGYGGPILFKIYAIMLDIMGISLILFVITGVILWLKSLQYNKVAWTMLILGFLYVGVVIGYLMLA